MFGAINTGVPPEETQFKSFYVKTGADIADMGSYLLSVYRSLYPERVLSLQLNGETVVDDRNRLYATIRSQSGRQIMRFFGKEDSAIGLFSKMLSGEAGPVA